MGVLRDPGEAFGSFLEVSERSWGGFERFRRCFGEGSISLERSWRGLVKGVGVCFGSFERSWRGFGEASRGLRGWNRFPLPSLANTVSRVGRFDEEHQPKKPQRGLSKWMQGAQKAV